jgi:hypothetical protein
MQLFHIQEPVVTSSCGLFGQLSVLLQLSELPAAAVLGISFSFAFNNTGMLLISGCWVTAS